MFTPGTGSTEGPGSDLYTPKRKLLGVIPVAGKDEDENAEAESVAGVVVPDTVYEQIGKLQVSWGSMIKRGKLDFRVKLCYNDKDH